MDNLTQLEGGHGGAAASSRLYRLITPDVAAAVGAWLLCLTGFLSLFTPSDVTASAVFRLTLAGTGFAFYGYGRTQKQRAQNARPGASETQLVRGLGGWLIVLGVMLAVTLVTAVIQAVTDIPQMLDGHVWAACTTPGQPAYHPGWATLLALDWGSNLYVLVFFPVLLSLFLQKKKTFRALTVGTLALFVALSAFRLWQVNQVPHIPAAAQASQFWSFVFASGKAAIWIPYLLISRRSRATFDQ
jgi:hypothetical protein